MASVILEKSVSQLLKMMMALAISEEASETSKRALSLFKLRNQ